MKNFLIGIAVFVLCTQIACAGKTAYVLKLEGAVGPITYHNLKRTLTLAEKENAECLILIFDTPGGLLFSTKKIDQEILSAKIPVIGFVYPAGAQCASAGTFIALACHILAMAPATNIGAAHPVMLGGSGAQSETLQEKGVNDAVSHIKGIAKFRNRNVKWAEDSVRKSVSITEEEAVKAGIADFIANDLNELLKKLHGRKIVFPEGTRVLNTGSIEIKEAKISFKNKILNIISNPNIAYILMIIGIWGIIFEFSNPGFGVTGIIGTISLVIAFFALHTLPLSTAGVILIILSLLFFGVEAMTPSFGLFLTAGIVSLFIGSFMLIKPVSEMRIASSLIFSAVATSGVFLWLVIWFAWKTRRRRVFTGKQGLIGEIGTIITDLNPTGRIFVHGEYWNAKSKSGLIEKDRQIRVIDIKGLLLTVEEYRETP